MPNFDIKHGKEEAQKLHTFDADLKKDINTMNLSSKVDSFIAYIADTYMEKDLEPSGKAALKKELMEGKKEKDKKEHRPGRRIYNGDDCRAPTPVSRRAIPLSEYDEIPVEYKG